MSDAALGDADRVFNLAVDHLAAKFAAIHPLDRTSISADRDQAIADLDRWAGGAAANWRLELVRFYEAHAPSALRPDPTLNAALRGAVRSGATITVASPLPTAAVELYLAQLGLRRAVQTIVADARTPATAVGSRTELLSLLLA